MYHVTFIDIEVEKNSKKILSLGGIKSNGAVLHTRSLSEFIDFLTDREIKILLPELLFQKGPSGEKETY
ncbi:MAG TPA: hypothetical protein VKZ51_02925 [Cyclobacteriaceae bacterium]|nr:hypothetical protein [Cyclobacteriaceae bacterium]